MYNTQIIKRFAMFAWPLGNVTGVKQEYYSSSFKD